MKHLHTSHKFSTVTEQKMASLFLAALQLCLHTVFATLVLRKVHTHSKPEKSTNTHAQQTGGVIPYRDITTTRSGPCGAVHVLTICIAPNHMCQFLIVMTTQDVIHCSQECSPGQTV